MKKALFIPLLVLLTVQLLDAQVPTASGSSFTAAPSTQTVDLGASNLFNVTFTLMVPGPTPANLIGFDMYIETAVVNSGFFQINSATPDPSSPFQLPSGAGDYPDVLSVNGGHTGFVQNSESQGFVKASGFSTTPFSNVVVKLSFAVNAGTPNGHYTFQTTGPASTTMYSSVSSTTTTYYVETPATFSIDVIPEPATWSLIALGGISALAISLLRRRRS